jgi:hypothetical protein
MESNASDFEHGKKTPLDKILIDAQFSWKIQLNLTAVQQN